MVLNIGGFRTFAVHSKRFIAMLIDSSLPLEPVRDLLGEEASDEQVVEVRDLLIETYAGERLSRIPQATWDWIRSGEGAPPPATALTPTATNMMELFVELPEEKQSQLLELARMMV